jgi:hypothetical protein
MLKAVPALAFALTSCASIVSKSDWPMTIESCPSGAEITVWDEEGEVVHSGPAPAVITLTSKEGFFTKADYEVEATLAGYEPVRRKVRAGINPWYFGNILFGGFIGLLIVDPATGAMWKLDDSVLVSLTPPSP